MSVNFSDGLQLTLWENTLFAKSYAEVIQETEAELARAGEFERCFPSTTPEDNDYYLQCAPPLHLTWRI